MLVLLALLLQPIVLEAPATARQGATLRVAVRGPAEALNGTRLRFAGRDVPIFPDQADSYLGLVPIPVALEPRSYTLEWLDSSWMPAASRTVEVADAHFPIQNIRVSKQVQGLKPLPGEMETIHDLEATVSEARWWHEPFLTPTAGCMSSPFGVQRYHNGKRTGAYHRGVDIRAPQGQVVRAITGGTVGISRMYRLHGGTVGVDHGQGVTSVYIHMSKLLVKEGDRVEKGDSLGLVGATGFATGPHLHWGLYVNGLPVNSVQWIPGISPCK